MSKESNEFNEEIEELGSDRVKESLSGASGVQDGLNDRTNLNATKPEQEIFKENDSNSKFNPMAIWYPNELDPNELKPTFSMVSFCPFLGKCSFFPMNYLKPQNCSLCNKDPPTTNLKSKVPDQLSVPKSDPITIEEKPKSTSSSTAFTPTRPPLTNLGESENVMEPVEITQKPITSLKHDSELQLINELEDHKISPRALKTLLPVPQVETQIEKLKSKAPSIESLVSLPKSVLIALKERTKRTSTPIKPSTPPSMKLEESENVMEPVEISQEPITPLKQDFELQLINEPEEHKISSRPLKNTILGRSIPLAEKQIEKKLPVKSTLESYSTDVEKSLEKSNQLSKTKIPQNSRKSSSKPRMLGRSIPQPQVETLIINKGSFKSSPDPYSSDIQKELAKSNQISKTKIPQKSPETSEARKSVISTKVVPQLAKPIEKDVSLISILHSHSSDVHKSTSNVHFTQEKTDLNKPKSFDAEELNKQDNFIINANKTQHCEPCPKCPECLEVPKCAVPMNNQSEMKAVKHARSSDSLMRRDKDDQLFDSHKRGETKNKNQASDLFNLREIANKDLGMNLLRIESFSGFQIGNKNIKSGLRGIKTLVDEKSELNSNGAMDFVDYFAKKNGTKYVGLLEEYFIQFYEKGKTEIMFASHGNPAIIDKVEETRTAISDTFRLVQVEKEKELQEYDFPASIEKDLKVFGIPFMNKIVQIGKIHNYGVQMILYWVKQLDEKKNIDPNNVHNVGAELLADFMILVYSIYTKLAEFFVHLVTHPTEKELELYTLGFFIRAFRNLVDGICDEIGAIGESCAQVLIRIPNLPRTKAIKALKDLYKQVNYANVSMSRAMECLAPAIHLFYIRFYLNRENNQQRIVVPKPNDEDNSNTVNSNCIRRPENRN